MMTALRFIWRSCKPRWLSAWQAKRNRLAFEGPYASWQAAANESRGYDDEHILKLTIRAARKVAAGNAAYDRDTVTFAHPSPDTLLMSALNRAGHQDTTTLRVLDFGGSLGSSFRQNRAFIKTPRFIDWHIVEQPSVAAAGAREFASRELHFHSSLEQALASGTPDFLLLSSVLQYLEQAESILDRLVQLPVKGALIARTPFWGGDHDLIVKQIVPPCVYRGSYPMRIFSRSKMLKRWEGAGMSVRLQPAAERSFTVSDVFFEFETWILHPRPASKLPPD